MVKYEKGKIVKATVVGTEKYGIFVSLDEEYSGMIHISEVSHKYVKNINDFVNIGDTINVEILDADHETYRLNLSIKNINYKKKYSKRKTKIKETSLGFRSLAYNLPIWIEKNIKKEQKTINTIDK